MKPGRMTARLLEGRSFVVAELNKSILQIEEIASDLRSILERLDGVAKFAPSTQIAGIYVATALEHIANTLDDLTD